MNLIKKRILIEDMHCTSCGMLIDGELEELEGVKSSTTNYAKAVCEVEFEEGVVSIEEIITKVKETGYKARLF